MVSKREPALDVGVAEKHDRRRSVQQAIDGQRRRKDVFVFVVNGAVNDGKSSTGAGPFGRFSRYSRFSGRSCSRVQSTALRAPD